jgi:hypothetical protein
LRNTVRIARGRYLCGDCDCLAAKPRQSRIRFGVWHLCFLELDFLEPEFRVHARDTAAPQKSPARFAPGLPPFTFDVRFRNNL